MKVYDITLPLHGALACWPGDAPYRFRWNMRRANGAAVNLGEVAMGVHVGTHLDAPYHYEDDGATVDLLSLTPFVGPARVIEVFGRECIRREDLDAHELAGTPRVLIKTNAWADHSLFPASIPVMELDVPRWLHSQGVTLVGLDLPSVDALESKDLPNHHALGEHGIQILESLYLAETPAGVYELIALPMRLVGADGAPVRAILRSLDDRRDGE